MRIAFVGCGYVADFYIQSLSNHRELELVGVYDRDEERRMRFSAHYGARTYGALEELLSDPEVELVVNLTNPRSHYEISKASLERGKHVYSEKPLSMQIEQQENWSRLPKKLSVAGLGAVQCAKRNGADRLEGSPGRTTWANAAGICAHGCWPDF